MPDDVYSIVAFLWGGGGAGGGVKFPVTPGAAVGTDGDGIGGGGGGGGYITAQLVVCPGTSLLLSVGVGSTASSLATSSTITGEGIVLNSGFGTDGWFLPYTQLLSGNASVAGGSGGVPSFFGPNVRQPDPSTGSTGQNGLATNNVAVLPSQQAADALQQSGSGGNSPFGGSGGFGARRLSELIFPPGSGFTAMIEPTTAPTVPGGGGAGRANIPQASIPGSGAAVARAGANGLILLRYVSKCVSSLLRNRRFL